MRTRESTPRLLVGLILFVSVEVFYFSWPLPISKIERPEIFWSSFVLLSIPMFLWGGSMDARTQRKGYAVSGLILLVLVVLQRANHVFYIIATAAFPAYAAGVGAYAIVVLGNRALRRGR